MLTVNVIDRAAKTHNSILILICTLVLLKYRILRIIDVYSNLGKSSIQQQGAVSVELTINIIGCSMLF